MTPPCPRLAPEQLRLHIAPQSLGFADTRALVGEPLPWIGQQRAFEAARFGLGLQQPDYHLFVLGEVGSGRASLMRQAMKEAAASRPVPPDLCFLHDFDATERPRALRLPAGQGRQLRDQIAAWSRLLEAEIPKRLAAPDVKSESERIVKRYQSDEAQAFGELAEFARARRFRLVRDEGQMLFTLLGPGGEEPLTEAEAAALSAPQRSSLEQSEQELRAEIVRFLDRTRPLERARDEALAQLLRQSAGPLVTHGLDDVRQGLRKQIKDTVKLGRWLDQVEEQVLDNLDLFVPHEGGQGEDALEDERREQLADLLALCQVNLAVDNTGLAGAPVLVEDNPQVRNLFGHIQYESGEDAPYADFSGIHAGGLLRAHGGFLMLFLRDLAGDAPLWERLRRFLRCNRVSVEDQAAGHGSGAPVALQPEGVDVEVKIVLVGSAAEYYLLQDGDADLARRFRVKVDFAEQFRASDATHHASCVFLARSCARRGLPHCTAAAAARLLEFTHREADDQARQSASFASLETLLVESCAQARARAAQLTDARDVDAALAARRTRHNAPEEALHEAIAEGELLITLEGMRVGQLNALTQIDMGDYRFGFPVRITARTHAGREGVVNIEREVEMSGPIHDKGVLILQSYLSALFGHLAPLALNASIVFEQEYSGIEGDSASCAELYALLSSLSGLALRQDIAVTGALNQHGEVLPVGGLNEKIEGWYRVCAQAGLTGTQGVLIPARNQRHLMLSPQVVQAVADGQFHVHAAQHVSEGVALLTGHDAGLAPGECLPGSVHARAEATLLAYRRAWQAMALGRRLPQRGR
ncbi:ATP-binding protein [Diaphorobacter limosus]|uniref:endopeptidase La n=1 Tax=Diaphorobacter limosus TaxID=3036128 RepID=A0ABZ0J8F8_9BURK|nr:ATP-binding protein [Diaphorobacter sp. Y-1]WOO33722.1 ATP-binding protein [Diaphorobacter sp. Y-1]